MGRVVGALVVVALAIACGPRAEPRASSDTTTVSVAEDAATAPAAVAAPAPTSMGPSEPGFTFCCGDGAFKIEIDCSQMLKRCYAHGRDGTWDATYGRHCRRQLGEACYLSTCDARCR